MDVEVRLRVPNMKVRALDQNGYPIDHASSRFRKVIQVATLPTPGQPLELMTRSGKSLQAIVVRADFSDERNLFIVSCQYASKSITAEDYGSLKNDPDWELKHLLE